MANGQKQTANVMYRKYKSEGGTLTFRKWITREKQKGFQNFTGDGLVPVNKPLTDSLNKTLAELRGENKLQNKLNNKYVLGIDRNYLFVAGAILIIVGGVIIYKKNSKK